MRRDFSLFISNNLKSISVWNNFNSRGFEMTKAIKTAINILGKACKNSANGLPFLRKLDTKKRSKLKISAAHIRDKKIEEKTCSKIR